MEYLRFSHPSEYPHLVDAAYHLARNSVNSQEKVLLVFSDAGESEHERQVSLDDRGELFYALASMSNYYDAPLDDKNWMAVVFKNYYYDSKVPQSALTKEELLRVQQQKFRLNSERLLRIIAKFKPTDIVVFDRAAFVALRHFVTWPFADAVPNSHFLGVGAPCKIGEVSCSLWASPSPLSLLKGKKPERSINLMGFVGRTMAKVFGAETYQYDHTQFLKQHETKLIDSKRDLDSLVDRLYDSPVVSIDTETNNLSVINNGLQIIQFAFDDKVGFVLPVKHKDSAFKGSLKRVVDQLGDFFVDNQSEYHIYHNAAFDLPMLRAELQIPYYAADIWDCMAGEFFLDENLGEMMIYAKTFNKVDAEERAEDDEDDEDDDYDIFSLKEDADTKRIGGYYSLASLSVQYGLPVYYSGEFGKEERIGISAMPLAKAGLLDYCAYDVTVPFAIHNMQKKRAKDEGYLGFELAMTKLSSAQLHLFASMRRNGELVDLTKLYALNMETSPIYKMIESLDKQLRDTPEVKEATKLVIKNQRLDQVDALFGSVETKPVFDFNKAEHQKALFSHVLKLEAPTKTKEGRDSYGKAFKSFFKEHPIVKAYEELGKAQKLQAGFLKPLLKKATKDLDAQVDGAVRAYYHFINVVTGRIAATDPNLQQIPQHSGIAKYVKDIFIAREGCLFLKVDFSAHELRGWSIISGCNDLARAFQVGIDLLKAFKKRPSKALADKFEIEGDIHKINASLFFAVAVTEVDKVLRNAVKAIAFGSIYGRTIASIADAIGMPVEEVQKVYDAFFERLPVAANWLNGIERVAERIGFVESPLHRRRHLYGFYAVRPDNRDYRGVLNALRRRARNSPIQGMGSDLGFTGARLLEKLVFFLANESGELSADATTLPLKTCNMVHDSNEAEAEYAWVLRAIEIIEFALTTGNQWQVEKLFGMRFTVDMAIEIEIGYKLSDMTKWAMGVEMRDKLDKDGNLIPKRDADGNVKMDKGKVQYEKEFWRLEGDVSHLYRIIENAVTNQAKEYPERNIDVEAVLHTIWQPSKTPAFLLDQILNLPESDTTFEKYGYYETNYTELEALDVRCKRGDFNKLLRIKQTYDRRFAEYETYRKRLLRVPKVK